MTLQKTFSKPCNQKYIAIGILLILFAAIYLIQKPQGDTIASVMVTYEDGTARTFDSSTLKQGVFYDPGMSIISSINLKVSIKPTIKGSDGSYPTTLPAGYTLTYYGPTMPIYYNDHLTCCATKLTDNLIPNTVNDIFTSVITTSDLDSNPTVANVPSGSAFTILLHPADIGVMGAKLHNTATGEDSLIKSPSSVPSISIVVTKKTNAASPTPTQTSTPSIGYVKIRSYPSNADVYMDGNYQGKTTSTGLQLSGTAGTTHKISISVSGYNTYNQYYTFTSGTGTVYQQLSQISTPTPTPTPTPSNTWKVGDCLNVNGVKKITGIYAQWGYMQTTGGSVDINTPYSSKVTCPSTLTSAQFVYTITSVKVT